MRVEQAHLFLYGALFVASAWAISAFFSSSLARFHVMAVVLTLGLGFILIPGHGEFIVVPLTAAVMPPIIQPVLMLAVFFALFWWFVSLVLLWLARRSFRKLRSAVKSH